MNMGIQSILGGSSPDGPFNIGGFWKIDLDDKGKAGQVLRDKVDLACFPPKIQDVVPGSYEKGVKYEENWSAFMSNTKVAYEGQDGSKVFVDFSYQTITRKVHYEVTQGMKGVRAENSPERHGHPLGIYFGPNATANRILGFAKGLVHKFMAMEGDEKDKLIGYIEKLMKAIEKGFGGLHKVAGMIRETYDMVMNGMVALQNELVEAQGAGATKRTYEETVTFTAASVTISIVA